MPIIKRYPNRKLYDTEAKRYVTLDSITQMIHEGQEVQVVDHETGEDLTNLTLSQIIFEQEKKGSGLLPRALLTNLVRAGGDTFEQVRRALLGGAAGEAAAKISGEELTADENSPLAQGRRSVSRSACQPERADQSRPAAAPVTSGRAESQTGRPVSGREGGAGTESS